MLGFVFALAESGLGLGAVVPGEVAISSLAASTDGSLALLVLGATVALGATAGDHVGFLLGHLGGGRLRESRVIARIGTEKWDRAADLMQRHGFWAVLVSRIVPFVRTVMPAVAGAAGLRYPAFVAASVVGAVGWSAVWVGAGAGIAATGVLGHPVIIAAVAAVAAAVVAVRVIRGYRARRDTMTSY